MKNGESHRVYWQQWLSPSSSNSDLSSRGGGRRELITSSAAIRISPDAAKARDVTKLLRNTLKLQSMQENGGEVDSLVLVGTLYSIPRDYVTFEHELDRFGEDDLDATTTVPKKDTTTSSQTDPFHVVKTLHPNDNPLEVRDALLAYLTQLQENCSNSNMRAVISPKIQWYFVPSTKDPTNPIPGCIDLDGYCSSMEDSSSKTGNHSDEEDQDEVDSEENSVPHVALDSNIDEWSAMDPVFSQCTFLTCGDPVVEGGQKIPKATWKQDHLCMQLTQSRLLGGNNHISGYLLKQSGKDPHVWRRMYCTLADDYMWYVSRRKGNSSKHGKISLVRALLLEPTSDYGLLYRVPHSFEVVGSSGSSHVFRATSKQLQVQWIQALNSRISEVYENSLLAHAEMIVADETIARYRRLTTLAVEPLSISPSKARSSEILVLGMQISEYREQCRHLQAILPARQPIVHHSEEKKTSSRNGDAENGSKLELLDRKTMVLIRSLWDEATTLLHRATQVAMDTQSSMDHGDKHRHATSLETLCRHIEYVVSGQLKQRSERTVAESNGSTGPRNGDEIPRSKQEPPPSDLFDALLAELQMAAVVIEKGEAAAT